MKQNIYEGFHLNRYIQIQKLSMMTLMFNLKAEMSGEVGEMSGDFAEKFIWACAFLFVYSLAGEIFLFKIVKMDLTNS